MIPLGSPSNMNEILEMIAELSKTAHEEAQYLCKHCKDKGLLEVWRLPDFHRALESNNVFGHYQINGPQWVRPYGADKPRDADGAYSSVAICDCEAGRLAKFKHPNLKVFTHESL